MPDETTAQLGDSSFVVDGDQLIDETGELPGQAVEQDDSFFNQDPLELAFNAGQAVASEPPERAHLDANPFPPDDPQHDAWLRGFKTVLEQQVKNDPATLLKQIDEKIGIADSTGGGR